MEKIKLQPLSDMEKNQAVENHGLVYSFLHKHGYSIEEYYNIVIFGFLTAIQVYNRSEDIRSKYKLSTVAFNYMRAEINNVSKGNNAQKRKPTETVLSLDADYSDSEMENLYNCTGGKSVEEDVVENAVVLEVLNSLSYIQRNIVTMKMTGYKNKEIFLILNIKPSTFYKELNRIKAVMEKIMN